MPLINTANKNRTLKNAVIGNDTHNPKLGDTNAKQKPFWIMCVRVDFPDYPTYPKLENEI